MQKRKQRLLEHRCRRDCLFSGLLLLLIGQSIYAQFQDGEELAYDVKYKYGIVVMTGARATYRLTATTYAKQPAWKALVKLNTTSFFDKMYLMRDTLTTYASVSDLKPLYAERIVHESNYHFTEKVTTQKFSPEQTQVYLKRYRPNRTMVDTFMTAEAAGYDMLSMLLAARAWDYDEMAVGTATKIAIFFGADQTHITIRYTGKQTIEVGKHRYNTFKLNLDLVDKAFTATKDAVEIWLSNDQNRAPVRIRAKLKIGAMEGELTSAKNLKHPFEGQIK